jgi:4-amino-4-deoxy-L-arabinose transferase-like glycosyltransferase
VASRLRSAGSCRVRRGASAPAIESSALATIRSHAKAAIVDGEPRSDGFRTPNYLRGECAADMTEGPRRLAPGTRWLLAILVLGAALRLVPIWFGVSYPLARPDEDTVVRIATRMQEGDLHPRFFHWPSLTFYAIAALYGMASPIRRLLSIDSPFSPAERVILARGFVACAGTLTLALLFVIGRRVADRTSGLLAALLLAVALLHVRDSHFAMTDVLMTCLLVASLALLLRAADTASAGSTPRDRALRWFVAAGLTAGLATATKYNAAALLGAMGAAQLILLVNRRDEIWRLRSWLPALAFTAAMALGFVVGTPYALLDFAHFEAGLRFNFEHLSVGHGIDLGLGWLYHLERSLPYGVGVPTFVAAIVGLVPIARYYRRHGVILAGFALPFYAAIGSGRTVFFRYVLPLVPILCLLAAVAIRHASQWLASRTRLSQPAALAVLTAAIAAPALVNAVWFDVLLARTDSRVIAAEWLAPRLKAGDSLYDSGGLYAKLDLRHRSFREWKYDPRSNSFGRSDGRTPDWLVLSESPLRVYAAIPAELRALAAARYDLVHTVPATRGRSERAIYDPQDAFFLPLSRFHTVIRPGPTIRIYRRKDARPSSMQPTPTWTPRPVPKA